MPSNSIGAILFVIVDIHIENLEENFVLIDFKRKVENKVDGREMEVRGRNMSFGHTHR